MLPNSMHSCNVYVRPGQHKVGSYARWRLRKPGASDRLRSYLVDEPAGAARGEDDRYILHLVGRVEVANQRP